MDIADARPPRFPVDYLTAVREWIWRHTSQPNGDPWDGDPEHLDWAAQNLVDDLAELLGSTNPQQAKAHAPASEKIASRPSAAQVVRLRPRRSAAVLAAHLTKGQGVAGSNPVSPTVRSRRSGDVSGEIRNVP